MVPHEHIRRCMGQWVICHTRRGDIRGHLIGCNGTHLFLQIPQYRTVWGETIENSQLIQSLGDNSDDLTHVFGFGNTAVALGAVIGLTAIGLSAVWW
jgi:hypothetical protein